MTRTECLPRAYTGYSFVLKKTCKRVQEKYNFKDTPY